MPNDTIKKETSTSVSSDTPPPTDSSSSHNSLADSLTEKTWLEYFQDLVQNTLSQLHTDFYLQALSTSIDRVISHTYLDDLTLSLEDWLPTKKDLNEENPDPYEQEARRLQGIKDETRDTNVKASTATAAGFYASAANGAFRIADHLAKTSPAVAPYITSKSLPLYAELSMLMGRFGYNYSSGKRSELRLDTSYATHRQDDVSRFLTHTSNFFSAISTAHAIPVATMIVAALVCSTPLGRQAARKLSPHFAEWMEGFLASKPDSTSKAYAWANYFRGPGFNVTGATGLVGAATLKTGDYIESNHRMDKAYTAVAVRHNISEEDTKKYVDAAIPHQTAWETTVFNAAYGAVCLPAALGGAAGSLYQFSRAYPQLAQKFSSETLKKAGDIGGMVNGLGYSLWPIVPAIIPPDVTYTLEGNTNLSERHLAEHLNNAWKAIHENALPELAIVGGIAAASLVFRFKYPTHPLANLPAGKADVGAGTTIAGTAVAHAVQQEGAAKVGANWFEDCPLLHTAFYVRSFSAGARLAMISSTTEYITKTSPDTPAEERDTYLRELAARTAVFKGLLTKDELALMSTGSIQNYLENTCYRRINDHRTENEKKEYQKKEREVADATSPESRPVCPEAWYTREIDEHIKRDKAKAILKELPIVSAPSTTIKATSAVVKAPAFPAFIMKAPTPTSWKPHSITQNPTVHATRKPASDTHDSKWSISTTLHQLAPAILRQVR